MKPIDTRHELPNVIKSIDVEWNTIMTRDWDTWQWQGVHPRGEPLHGLYHPKYNTLCVIMKQKYMII